MSHYYIITDMDIENHDINERESIVISGDIEITTDTVGFSVDDIKLGINSDTVSDISSNDLAFLHEQDFKQRVNMSIQIALELYRVLVSSLLILFVPQDCGGRLCTYHENMFGNKEGFYMAGLVINYLTMFVFVNLYYAEYKREDRMIKYMDVNKALPFDNESVGLALAKVPEEKRVKIHQIDKMYQKCSYVAFVMYILNTIVSGLIVYKYYLGNQTTTTFVTNILFMATKLADVYNTVNTEDNVFYSAYLKEKTQYNDVDPDYKVIE